MMRRAACVIVVGIAAVAPTTRAQPAAAAEQAFREGRRLVAAGRYADACPKFEESQRLDPAPGTLLNLGDCYEQLGRTASAWNAFVEAAAAARRTGHAERAAEAQRRADAVEPQLSRVAITLRAPPPRVDVKLDGNPVTALVGDAIPVDPGDHALEVSAPDRVTWRSTITVAPRTTVPITVPALATATQPVVEPGERRGRRMTPLTWGLLAGGAAALGIGVGIDIWAYGAYQRCEDRGGCMTDGEVDRIGSRMLVGDILIGVGIASAGAAGILYYLNRGAREPVVTVAPDLRRPSVVVQGRF